MGITNYWILYEGCKITPEKNFKVDDLSSYLNTLNKTTIPANPLTGIAPQYIKHALNLSIKLNLPQSELNFNNGYNYIYIKNHDDVDGFYYFIVRKTWTAQNTVSLVLKMDTVNSYTTEGGYFSISDKTLIHRQHKDRIIKTATTENLNPITPNASQDVVLFSNIIGALTKDEILFDLDINYIESGFSNYITCSLSNSDQPFTIKLVNKDTLNDTSIIGNCSRIYLSRLSGKIIIRGSNKGGVQLFEEHISISETKENYLSISKNKNATISSPTTSSTGDKFLFSKFARYYVNHIFSDVYKRVIDYMSEGINLPLYKNSSQTKTISQPLNVDWYLIYKNQNDPDESLVNPVSVYVCASGPFQVRVYNSTVINYSSFGGSEYFFFTWLDNENLQFSDERFYLSKDTPNKVIRISRYNTNKINIQVMELRKTAFGVDYWEFLNSAILDDISVITTGAVYHTVNTPNASINDIQNALATDINSYTYKQVNDISSINRTDPKYIKIIKLPYAPFDYTVLSGGELVVNSNYVYDETEKLIRFSNYGSKINSSIRLTGNDNPYSVLLLDNFTPSITDLKNPFYESKLYHSDYYRPKFYYDSFSKVLSLEKLLSSYVNPNNDFDINFHHTTTINSRFLFHFKDYITNFGSEDYDNFLIITRNNEETLFNQAYINYLKTGYNYDVKARNRQIAVNLAQGVVQVGGVIGGVMSGGAVGGAVATGLLSKLIGNINQSIASQEAIDRKITETENQATSVSGSDDIDLLSIYSENRLKFNIYTPNNIMLLQLYDLFFYTGYICNYQGIPDFTSRTWFNFVSCELVFTEIPCIPEECLEDLKSRYSEGITVLHKVNNSYDFEQEKENWEVNLFN